MQKNTKDLNIPNKNLIKGAIRRLFSRSPVIKEVRAKALHPTKKGVRGGKQYICSECKKTFGMGDINVDHIEPVIPLDKTINDMDYNEIVERIFCDISNLQVMCKPCHKDKTKQERKEKKRIKGLK